MLYTSSSVSPGVICFTDADVSAGVWSASVYAVPAPAPVQFTASAAAGKLTQIENRKSSERHRSRPPNPVYVKYMYTSTYKQAYCLRGSENPDSSENEYMYIIHI